MFWGVTLESGKRYSQVVESSYHLSMAALEPMSKEVEKSNKYVSVMIEHGKSEFLLCTLEHDRVMQVPLDLVFVEGEEVSFFLSGEGIVHLTGYVTDERQEVNDDSYQEDSQDECETSYDDENMYDDGDDDYYSKLMQVEEDSDSSSNEEWVPQKVNKKKKHAKKDKTSKGIKSNFKMQSNLLEDSVPVLGKSRSKNEDEDEDEDECDSEDNSSEETNENFIEVHRQESNIHFKPKSKKHFKKEETFSPFEEQSSMKTSMPVISRKISEDQILNKQVNCSSIKKHKKIANKQKFSQKNKINYEEERPLQENATFSSQKKRLKKKHNFKAHGNTDNASEN
ncbi:46 kDa FK506-binding nuclear protein-like [Centruroides sculpturatus]|uniref:46 kDa FK506-binding nuclear protein-like n=1 Tax=Centruroides sculpturatus TaxID=218467 RepID=UPI000C6E77C1|nr:46 kDa FK506-binding nuclear protein-like [Centruroides sculpturatus]XP_023226522.1 46 kDa FK506-binding nuclear protein-like [Centruroides sculpturatus]